MVHKLTDIITLQKCMYSRRIHCLLQLLICDSVKQIYSAPLQIKQHNRHHCLGLLCLLRRVFDKEIKNFPIRDKLWLCSWLYSRFNNHFSLITNKMKVALRSKGEGQNPHQMVEGMWQTDRETCLFGVLYKRQYVDYNFQISKNYKQQVTN